MRTVLRPVALLLGLLAITRPLSAAEISCDVLVYGATPAGIAAALAAGKSDRQVLLVESTRRIGGLLTSGLSHTDFHSLESLSGTFLEFTRRVEAHYARIYGPGSAQVKDSYHGTFGEPSVNLAIFQQMLQERPTVQVRTGLWLTAVESLKNREESRIHTATFLAPTGSKVVVKAAIFIDCTYEGDLMALAGVPWRTGREGKSEYGESLAPETADSQLQAYNFRFVMTQVETNRITPVAPPGYDRTDFLPALEQLASGRIKTVFGYPQDCVFKAQTPPLPNGKYDINDVSKGLIRLSLPGRNLQWPNGTRETREQIFLDHLRDNVGLLYFLQNDTSVPEKFRTEARTWGWCRDEFTETAHLPPQLYVREARRMVGGRIFTQADSDFAKGDARAVLHRDSIAMGDYGNNCHGTARDGTRFKGQHTGEFYNPVPPYQIPYATLLPKHVQNLFVPVACSASHVGFCALRLEPIWTSLGQAAGHAAAIALQTGSSAQAVTIPDLQARLHADGSATVYFSDVLPGHPQFASAQWWGTAGGFHGLASTPSNPRGPNLHGQYFQAAPRHAAELNQPLDAALAQRWTRLAAELGLRTNTLPQADGKTTRGDFIRAAAQLRPSQK